MVICRTLSLILTGTLTGSDLHNYRGNEGKEVDYVLGHEAVGKIVEIGEAVTGFDVGDLVICPFSLSCGTVSRIFRASLATTKMPAQEIAITAERDILRVARMSYFSAHQTLQVPRPNICEYPSHRPRYFLSMSIFRLRLRCCCATSSQRD